MGFFGACAGEMGGEFHRARLVAWLATFGRQNVEPVPLALLGPGFQRSAIHIVTLLGGNGLEEIVDGADRKGRIARAHQTLRIGRRY
jgi:hypothetical protein